MRSIFPILTVALALGACLGAHAQSTVIETIPGTPAAADAPRASKGEALATRQFGWLDLDHDGYLSREEVALFPRLRDSFDQADQDHDNRVSLDEIRALALQRRAEKDAAKAAAAPAPATPQQAAKPW